MSKSQKPATIESMMEMGPLSSEELHKAYVKGEPAVYALLESWMKQVLVLVEKQQAINQVLETRVHSDEIEKGGQIQSPEMNR